MRALVLSTLLILLCASEIARADPALQITNIIANDRIEGTITDPNATAQTNCVVVYVHTDIWYIHPFAAGGPNQSWAEIEGTKWSIPTIKREFAANAVAAVLLKKTQAGRCDAPAKLDGLDDIARETGEPFIKHLSQGDTWFGRL